MKQPWGTRVVVAFLIAGGIGLAGCGGGDGDDGPSTPTAENTGGGPLSVSVSQTMQTIAINNLWCDGQVERLSWPPYGATGFNSTSTYSGCPGESHVLQFSGITWSGQNLPHLYSIASFTVTIDGGQTLSYP